MACSQFEPFEDMHREAGKVQPNGLSSNDEPVICYNPLWQDLQETQVLADQACQRTHRKAVYKERHLFYCRLATPTAVTYQCQ